MLLIDKTSTVDRPTKTRNLAMFDGRPLAPIHLVVKSELLVSSDAPCSEEGQAWEPGVQRVDPTRVHHQVWVTLGNERQQWKDRRVGGRSENKNMQIQLCCISRLHITE